MKKKLIWCIGPEGMGHHMCQEIFKDLWKGIGKFDQIFPGIIHYWNNMITPLEGVNLHFNNTLMEAANSPINTFVFTPSSPYDNPRDSIRRPDILEFYTHFSKVFDIRLIHTYRDPVESAYSLVRRGWFQTTDIRIKNQILYQAKIVEDNLLYNKAHLEVIGKENWKTLHYEKIVNDPESVKDNLAEWSKEPEIVEKGIKTIQKPHDRKDIPQNDLFVLERFFSKKRLSMWEDFYLSNSL